MFSFVAEPTKPLEPVGALNPPAATAAPRFARPPRILLVEDNPVNQRLAFRILQQAGCLCTIATDGEEALSMLASPEMRRRYDLVFMDCQMPRKDGYAATIEIRALERATGGRLPIIAMTANALVGDRERCLASGMDDYLAKPFDRRALVDLVAHHFTA